MALIYIHLKEKCQILVQTLNEKEDFLKKSIEEKTNRDGKLKNDTSQFRNNLKKQTEIT